MFEFLQNYGLWIALAAVFFTMHRFGTGCCGGGHHQKPVIRDKEQPGATPKDETGSEVASKLP